MKNIVRLFCLMIGLVLIFSLASCKKEKTLGPSSVTEETGDKAPETEAEKKIPETVEELWLLIDEKMSALNCYELDTFMNTVMYDGGYKIVITSTGHGISIGETTDPDFYRFNKETSEMKCEELEMDSKRVFIEAYNDGNAFYSNVEGDISQKFYMETTPEKFYENSNSVALTEEIDIKGCLSKEMIRNEDGGWTVKFSNYTKKNVNNFLSLVGIADAFGVEILDLNIGIRVNSEYYAESLTFEFVFDTEENDVTEPEFIMELKYKNFGAAQKYTDEINTADYLKVDDYTVIGKAADELEGFINGKEGSLTLDIKYTLSKGTDTFEQTEKDVATFGTVNGGFVFKIDALFDGTEKASVTYEKGVYVYTENQESEKENLTDDEAREVFFSMIDDFRYVKEDISNVEKLGDGEYKLTVSYEDDAFLVEAMEEMELDYKSYEEVYIVTFKEDKLYSIENDLKMYGVFDKTGGEEYVEYRIHTLLVLNNVDNGPSVA